MSKAEFDEYMQKISHVGGIESKLNSFGIRTRCLFNRNKIRKIEHIINDISRKWKHLDDKRKEELSEIFGWEE